MTNIFKLLHGILILLNELRHLIILFSSLKVGITIVRLLSMSFSSSADSKKGAFSKIYDSNKREEIFNIKHIEAVKNIISIVILELNID